MKLRGLFNYSRSGSVATEMRLLRNLNKLKGQLQNLYLPIEIVFFGFRSSALNAVIDDDGVRSDVCADAVKVVAAQANIRVVQAWDFSR